jgi:D-threo-aldose 1-dehydrogenase
MSRISDGTLFAFNMLDCGPCAERYVETRLAVNLRRTAPDQEVTVGYAPFDQVPLGRTQLRVTRLGFGGASIGGLYHAVGDSDARSVVRHAWAMGIRYFDVAPLYGYGRAERHMGGALAGEPRDTFVLSTKVGRLLYPSGAIPAGADRDRQLADGREDAYYVPLPDERPVFDYSYDGVMRSLEESLERLGIGRIDILYIHDPDDHWEAAIGGAYPALERLRSERVVGAIGAGMNQAGMLARFAREGDFDAFLVAGRYTLLDHAALTELLPLCVERDIAVVIGGVMNSGLLADPRPGSRFDYRPAEEELVRRAQHLREVCARHGVPLKAAAVQFPLAHPAVASLVAGVRTTEHLDEYPALMQVRIPGELWDELRAEGLIPDEAPTPPPPA